MRSRVALALILVSGLGMEAASAASITNRDTKEYKVTIIEGEKTQNHVLKPSDLLKEVCAKGCVVRLNDSENDEYELEGTEVVSIEEGFLYYDVPDTVPGTDPGSKTDAPKK